MQIVDLFSGIGGFSLSGNWMNWQTVQFVEIDRYCQRVLNKHWPNVPIHSDIKTFGIETLKKSNWNPSGSTIITGGFPCQPFSVAGKQKGQSDDRHLWPEMLRVIREICPTWIVGENVPGIIGMELENICLALEGEGYEVQPFVIPSAGIGAWDKRERVWIIAHNNQFRCDNEQKRQIQTLQNTIGITEIKEQGRRQQQCGVSESNIITSDIGLQRQEINEKQTMGSKQLSKVNSDSNGEGLSQSGQESAKQKIYAKFGIKHSNIKNSNPDKFNSDNAGYNSGTISQQQKTGIQVNCDTISSGRENGLYGRKQEWETGKRSHDFKECDWWQRNWIEVASELCRSNARIPNRLDRIKGLGNSVNPYVPYQIFKAIQQYEDILNVEPKTE